MAMPIRRSDYDQTPSADVDPSHSSEVRCTWPSRAPQPNAVEFALHDAQNMLALLAANVEFLIAPDTEPSAVTGDIRESTRRLGELLNVVAAFLKEPA